MFSATGRILVLTAFAATLATQSRALESNPFHFEADYLSVVQGSAGGIDEFNDGVLNGWEVVRGTAREEGGVAIVESPGGATVDPMGGTFFLREHTVMDTLPGNPLNITLGGGDATATSKWMPSSIPQSNQLYGMSAQIDFDNGTADEEFFVFIVNAAADLAGSVGLTEGLYMGFQRGRDGLPDVAAFYEIPDLAFASTDDVILQLFYNQAADQFEASFSAKAGAFQSDVLVWGISDLGGVRQFQDWSLGAQSFVLIPEPSTALLLASGLAALALRRRSSTR